MELYTRMYHIKSKRVNIKKPVMAKYLIALKSFPKE